MSISLKALYDQVQAINNKTFGIIEIFRSNVTLNINTSKTITVPANTKWIIYEFTPNDDKNSKTYRPINCNYDYLKSMKTLRYGYIENSWQQCVMELIGTNQVKLYGDKVDDNSNINVRNMYAITY